MMLLSSSWNHLLADTVSYEKASKLATNWYRYFAPQEQKSGSIASYLTSGNDLNKTIYIFSFTSGGFVIVSGEDMLTPVLAYSFNSDYQEEAPANTAINNWLKNFSNLIDNKLRLKTFYNKKDPKWEEFLLNDFSRYNKKSIDEVKPLITANWGQGDGWNKYCPEDAGGSGGHAAVGCVAVAMGQVMNKWKQPASGSGSKSYESYLYGNIYADFENTNYQWSGMNDLSPDDYNSLLLYHCGVSIGMVYGPNNSSADTYSLPAIAFSEYFDYNSEIVYKKRSDYSLEVWEDMVRNELICDIPLIYRAQDATTKGGHAFNVDGYQNEFFHINWGWGGKRNGYFLLEIPVAGQWEFSLNQGAVFGIYPNSHYVYHRPENLTVNPKISRIELIWEKPLKNDQDYYNVYRNNILIDTTVQLSYIDNNVEEGIEYHYYITAVYDKNNLVESAKSNVVFASLTISKDLPYFNDLNGELIDWKINGGNYKWNLFNNNSGRYLACRPFTNSGFQGNRGNIKDRIISPHFDLSNCKSVSLSFDYVYTYLKYHQKFEIYYRSNEDTDWVKIVSPEHTDYYSNINWENISINIPKEALTSEMQIGFYYESGITPLEYSEINQKIGDEIIGVGIDNIKISDNGAYPPVSDFKLQNSNGRILLNFQKPPNNTDCDIKIFRNDILIDIVDGNNYLDNNVIKGLQYSYYIIADYDGKESSRSEILEITAWDTENIPYSENYEESIGGWIKKEGPVNWTLNNNDNSDIFSANRTNYLHSNNLGQSEYPFENIIISPGIEMLNKQDLLLSFDYILFKNEKFEEFGVYYRTPNEYFWHKIKDIKTNGDWDSWTREYIELPEKVKSSFTQIAFKYSSGVNKNKKLAGIDNVKIEEIKSNSSPVNLRFFRISNVVDILWDGAAGLQADYYKIYRNDSLIGTSNEAKYRDKQYIPGNYYTYRVSAFYHDFKDLESKPSDPLNIYVDIPYKQDFLRINNSWSINNTKGYYKYSPVYSDPNENLVNETGFIYYGLGHDNIMYSDRIISPLFDLSKNKDALIRFDYTFITDNSNNNLTIGYRISPTEEWKNFFVLPQTDNARIYRSIVIDIPAEAKTIGTQFSVYFNNENNSQNSIVRIDNFEIKKFDNKESQIELISDFTNGNANLSWNSDEIENVEYYNVYRNLKLVGQTKDNYFIDSTIRSDKTYYFTVRSCTKRDNIGSVPSNSVTVNPNPLFTIPYNQTFNNSNNIQWLVDDVFWKYIKNKNFGVNTNNVTPFYGFNIDNIQSQLNDSWLSSPIFQIQEFNDISLSFEYIYKIYDVEGNQSLGIYYKTTKADNWILIKNLNRTISSSNWQLIDFFLPEELEGEKFQIGFKISNESQNSNLMLVGIDNFRIFSKKGLLQPINFNVVSNENAVELNWMAAEGSNPSKYKVYKNDSLIAETNSTFYKDIIDQVDQKYIYKITAIYSGPVFGESLPVINELLKNNFSLPYYIDFENGYEGWDISGNSIGWKWNNNSDMDEHKYIFTEFPAIPSEDLVKSNYFYLDFPGTVSISYDYSFFGQENQYFSLLYRNVLDSVWTVLQEMQVNSLSSLQTFTNCTFILPPEACRKNIQFAFSFRNESSVAANAAIDYFKIDVLKGIYTPEKLEYFVNNEFIGLNWNRPKERAPEYYNIYKNDSLINSSKSPNYYDYNVINGVTYTYKITAVYSGINSGESFPTNQVRVVPVAYKEVPYFQEFNDNGNDWLFSEKDTDFRLLTADEADFGEENTSKFVGVKTKNPLETWLMSPLFNVTAETNVFLTFEYFFKNYYIFNELNIYYRHSPQGEWTNLCEIEPSDNTWKNFELQLPEELLADSLQLAIVFINNRKSASFSECGIDNVGLFEKTGEKPLLIKSFDFNVYPNPSNGIIEVNFDFESETNEELIIDVIDINGRVIYNNSIRSNGFESVINLDLTRQIKGIYYLRVYSVGKVHSKKIIIS